MLITKSGIIEEIKMKITSKAGKHANKSVFFKDILHQSLPNGRRTLQNTGGGNAQGQQGLPKRAILRWGGNFKGFKEKKRVTFSYLPSYKEDEDNAAQKRKIAKDLPIEPGTVTAEDNHNT